MWKPAQTVAVCCCVSLLVVVISTDARATTVRTEHRKSVPGQDVDGISRTTGADFITEVVPQKIDVDLRNLHRLSPWKAGDPIITVPRRTAPPRITDPAPVNLPAREDPLLERQRETTLIRGLGGFSTLQLNFEGDNSGSNPHDPNGDVGPDYYVQAINGPGGTRYTFYDKTDGSVVAGPFTLSDLADSGPCTAGAGDPIVLYDELAGRWLLTEFSESSNRMCVYVAQTGDPIAGGWYAYDFQGAEFPDYPKYGVWHDAYYVGTNEGDSALYAFERNQMLQGLPAMSQRFAVTRPAAFAFAVIAPVDHDGTTAPPPDAPGIFIRHFDDEAHNPGNNDPQNDLLQLWELEVDWGNANNSVLTGPIDVPIAEFDSEQCGYTAFHCYPQPGTSVTLDPLREVVMNMPKYRNFGAGESIVGNLTTDVDGTDHGGIRWFELRRSGASGWSLYQEGTFAPDVADGAGATEHRWMAASAMDSAGNIAVGYNISNDITIFPGLAYNGRLASDPGGVLTAGESAVIAGSSAHTTSTRWGDYASLSVDPDDACTFWFTANYGSVDTAPTAATRIASFRFESCGEPGFSLNANHSRVEACTDAGPDMLDELTLRVGSIEGFADPVDLAFDPPLASGFSGSIAPQQIMPAIPAAESVLQLTADETLIAGDHIVTVAGTAIGATPRSVDITVNVADGVPGDASLLTPADGATDTAFHPVFSWEAVPHAHSYLLEVATDSGFSDEVLEQVANGTALIPAMPLPSDTLLYWRVTATNQCGAGPASAVHSFTTALAPGECGSGTEANLHFQDDMESGTNGWSHEAAAGDDTWAQDENDSVSPTTSWAGQDVSVVSDQRLMTPEVALPADVDVLTLQFFTRFGIEPSVSGCYDGGLLEYSDDGGSTWTQIGNDRLVNLPYKGTVNNNFENPLGGLEAWCGTENWINAVVDLTGLENMNVRFRFRLGTDNTQAADEWRIDDLKVQSCAPSHSEIIHADGFEDLPL